MRRHLSPALVISIIALVGAWGGPAMAKALIGSGQIKDKSIKGRDVATGTLTGRTVTGLSGKDILPDSLQGSDIDESTLRKVAEADSASKVAGVRIERFAYADPKGESAVFFEDDNIQVSGFCNNGVTEARAVSKVDDGLIRNAISTPDTGTQVQSNNDFDRGATVDLLPADLHNASGALTFYEPGGRATIVQYLAESGLPPETGHQCIVAGVAVQTDK